jgi:hypothetical protein
MVFVNCFPFFLSCRFFFFLRYLPILKTPYAAATPTTTTLFNSQSPFEEVQKAAFLLKKVVDLRSFERSTSEKISHKCQNFTRWVEPKKSVANCCTEAEKMRIPEVSF